MFVISLKDLLQLDKFKHLTELELTEKKYDREVLAEAFTIGLDITEGYSYEAALHRSLSSREPHLGIRLVGEIRKDAAFRRSPAYTPEMQLLSSLRKDVSLTKELCNLSGTSFDYGKMTGDDADKEWDEEENHEADYKEVMSEIDNTNTQIYAKRGSPINEWGSYKKFSEWQEAK